MPKPKAVASVKPERKSQAVPDSEWISGGATARILEVKAHSIVMYAAMNGIRVRLLPGSQVLQFSRSDVIRATMNGVSIPKLPTNHC